MSSVVIHLLRLLAHALARAIRLPAAVLAHIVGVVAYYAFLPSASARIAIPTRQPVAAKPARTPRRRRGSASSTVTSDSDLSDSNESGPGRRSIEVNIKLEALACFRALQSVRAPAFVFEAVQSGAYRATATH
jgi:hypothetical protein